AQFRHRNAALSLAQHRHDLRLGKSGFSYSNLLSSRYEKILLPHPLNHGEDYRWTHGGEKGAHNYIDNLSAKKNAYITPWESASLKEFFTHVRKPFGHGAGSSAMPSLSRPQIEWAIEFSMIWVKNLIRRM
ncbi:hypothetical protein, partial [Paracoccus shanxieyensis]|uniref:hypothetical protein n=1 Tax=Paracoccus shanxieyensis TaxID=2675752 RepID=UPI001E62E640